MKIKLKKGDCFHLFSQDSNLVIRSSENGNVIERTVINCGLENETTVALCDEEIVLSNGKKLRRNRNKLTIV